MIKSHENCQLLFSYFDKCIIINNDKNKINDLIFFLINEKH